MTITQNMRGRPVTQEEAIKSAHRFIDHYFHNHSREHVRVTIPVNYTDDDVVLTDYILEQESK
jgi:hypothetical protein